jgi:hypothetical protein
VSERPGVMAGERAAKIKPVQSHKRGAGKPFVKGDVRICRDAAMKGKGKQFQAFVREWLEHPGALSSEPEKSRTEVLLNVLWEAALSGTKDSVPAVEALLNRGYGKPTQLLGEDRDNPFGGGLAGNVAALNGRVGGKPSADDVQGGGE